MTEMLRHTRRRDCPRYGEPIRTADCERRDGEAFHRCPSCGAAMDDLPARPRPA